MSENFIACAEGRIQVIKIMNDYATAKIAMDFKAYLFEIIDQGYKKIIIDLSRAQLMDSTFLGALVISYRKIKEVGGDIVVACMTESVSITFGLTKLVNVFTIYDSIDEAKRELSSNPD